MSEKQIVVHLTQEQDYRFQIAFGGEVPGLIVDEPPPLGHGNGPSPVQLLAAAVGGCLSDSLPIHVCHFPPGTSKWNKIEHRMFSHITQNWRGRPLVSHEVIVNLIVNTTTKTGLKIRAELDRGKYPNGIKITDPELALLNLKPDNFHGEWSYTVLPVRKKT